MTGMSEDKITVCYLLAQKFYYRNEYKINLFLLVQCCFNHIRLQFKTNTLFIYGVDQTKIYLQVRYS